MIIFQPQSKARGGFRHLSWLQWRLRLYWANQTRGITYSNYSSMLLNYFICVCMVVLTLKKKKGLSTHPWFLSQLATFASRNATPPLVWELSHPSNNVIILFIYSILSTFLITTIIMITKFSYSILGDIL